MKPVLFVAFATIVTWLTLTPITLARAQTTRPDATTLLRQSLATMKATRYLHAVFDAQAASTQNPSTDQLHITGDCDMGSSSSSPVRVIAHVQERMHTDVPPSPPKIRTTNAHFIIISSTKPRVWKRSARTGNRWRRLSNSSRAFKEAEGYPLSVCPYTFYRGLAKTTSASGPFALTNQGPETVNGRDTWHLVAQKSSSSGDERIDLFVDQQTSAWRRVTDTGSESGATFAATGNYSQFNVPVRITAPKT